MSPAASHFPSRIAERIARARLTRAQHRMAGYVLAHPFRVATMTIDEFAAATDVSVASANRFARALDLPGYPQFRSLLARGFEAALAPVEKLRDGLAQSDAGSAAQIFAATLQEDIDNAQRSLQALDAQIKNTMGTLPAGQRTVLTAHGAFNYFGQAYGLKFLSPAGLSTESEATAGDMRRLIGQLRQQQVAAIFLEHNANPRLVQRLAAETGMPVSGTLYADMLSASDGPAASYVDMMQYNLRTLVDGIKNGSASSGRR